MKLCSDLRLRFHPASEAWCFLHNLPLSGYANENCENMFQINFALFQSRPCSSVSRGFSMPLYEDSTHNYSIEMLWSLGYVFRDKYNDNYTTLWNERGSRNFSSHCEIVWKNLKSNHCFQLVPVSSVHENHVPTPTVTDNSNSEEKVAFAIITPHRVEYQPMLSTPQHRGFQIFPRENWLLVRFRDTNGFNKVYRLNDTSREYWKTCMIRGIQRNGQNFLYFGSSGSQLREQAGWFLAIDWNMNIEQARKKIGNLENLKNVSTFISRVGLYLTTSKDTQVKSLKAKFTVYILLF